ncbi:MAG TPA: hypothetical protein VNT22_06525 [Baekduia sp.]|nr:hypothetical protein [Baekduia sp.]
MATQDLTTLAGLREQRRVLARRVALLTLDLGGLTYEMAVRDHIRPDVLVKKAAELQAADAELAELQRVIAESPDGQTGNCRSCGVVSSAGATYCWDCGAPLAPEAAVGEQAPTVVLDPD